MSNKIPKTALKQQQELAEFYAPRGSIIWDLFYTDDSKELLLEKVKCLFPDDCGENQNKLKSIRENIVEAVYNQRKYSEGNLLTSIIFVLHTPTIYQQYSNAKNCTNYSLYPLFRVRKCKKNDNSENCCMIFVDILGRVYQNWNDFLCCNQLPQGTIIAPRQGIYKLNSFNEVLLEYHLTPESGSGNKALKALDYTATGLSIVGSLAAFRLLFPPVAVVTTPIIATCSVIGALAGGWFIGRSSAHLADRGNHEQSINVTNNEARGAWLGIAGGTIGIGAMSATQALSIVANSGRTITPALARTVQGINGISIGLNAIQVVDNVTCMIMKKRDDEKLTSMDVLQLSTSLFLFTNSIHNFRTAQKLINSSQSVVNRTFGMLRKLFVENNNISVDERILRLSRIFLKGIPFKTDIIFPIKKIPHNKYTNDVLDILEKIHKQTFKLPPQNTRKISNSTDVALIPKNSSHIDRNIIYFIIDQIEMLKKLFFVGTDESLVDAIMYMAENCCHAVLCRLIEMAQQFYTEIEVIVRNKFKTLIPFEDILWMLYEVIKKELKVNYINLQFLIANTSIIFRAIRQKYQNLTQTYYNQEIKCNQCGGYYKIVNI